MIQHFHRGDGQADDGDALQPGTADNGAANGSIVVAGLGKKDAILFHAVDEAVFLGWTRHRGRNGAENSGLPIAFEGIATDGFNQIQDPKGGFTIRGKPMFEIFQEIPDEHGDRLGPAHTAPDLRPGSPG